MEFLKVPQGVFQLKRYPFRSNELLRAWDAADEYLLQNFHNEHDKTAGQKRTNILIINDSFGALTTALAVRDITVWTDSFLTEEGIKYNLNSNHLASENIKIINSIDTPTAEYDFIFIKIPKSLALLEDQLIRIQPLLSVKTIMMAAGMVKSIHVSTLKLFEKYIGLTKTSLAKKKSRLIFCTIDKSIVNVNSPYPKSYNLENTNHTILNHANVFSRNNLDIGTRFFLQHLPQSNKYKNIIDLGCGNGVVGLIAADKNMDAIITFLDESYMAVDSARQNFEMAFGDSRKSNFQVNDCLRGIEKNSADLILNNPPFHQDNAVGDEVAWRMFKQSKDILVENGEIWVIGNRHLGYHIKLKKIFGNCETIASNKKFVVLKSVNL